MDIWSTFKFSALSFANYPKKCLEKILYSIWRFYEIELINYWIQSDMLNHSFNIIRLISIAAQSLVNFNWRRCHLHLPNRLNDGLLQPTAITLLHRKLKFYCPFENGQLIWTPLTLTGNYFHSIQGPHFSSIFDGHFKSLCPYAF